MARYLLDTNILLRIADPISKKKQLTEDALSKLLEDGNSLFISPQILTEFWSVATRPRNNNGLELSTHETREEIDNALDLFYLVYDPDTILVRWLELVTDHDIKGKRVHDIKLLALMLETEISHLLTYNPGDFVKIKGITLVNPAEIINSS